MFDMSGVPIRRSEPVSKKRLDGSSVDISKALADGILPILAINEKQERDSSEGNKKDNQLGQFLRGIKDPSANEITIEDL